MAAIFGERVVFFLLPGGMVFSCFCFALSWLQNHPPPLRTLLPFSSLPEVLFSRVSSAPGHQLVIDKGSTQHAAFLAFHSLLLFEGVPGNRNLSSIQARLGFFSKTDLIEKLLWLSNSAAFSCDNFRLLWQHLSRPFSHTIESPSALLLRYVFSTNLQQLPKLSLFPIIKKCNVQPASADVCHLSVYGLVIPDEDSLACSHV